MSRDLIGAAHQVLSSNDLEIQELVNRISSARYLDESQKSEIIKVLGFKEGLWGKITGADAKKKAAEVEKNKSDRSAAKAAKERGEKAEADKKKREREAKKRAANSPEAKKAAAQKQRELDQKFRDQESGHAYSGGVPTGRGEHN
jgi:hypothetical protein